MRFQLTHKLATYLLVLAAMGTLAAANLLTPGAAALAIVAGALSWFVDPGTRAAAWVERATPALRLGATVFFGVTAYEVWSRLPEPDLTPVVSLVLFLVVYKLFQRAANRDYLQIYVLAFLMVLAGAAFAQSFLFAAAFTAYVVLTTWTLILVHLRREMEDNYLVKHSGNAPSHKVGVARILGSRRVVGLPFLAATAGVALAVCAGSVATFAVIPRVGAGFAFGGARARKNLIGFSDEVTLGAEGFLSAENDTVALRAVVPRIARARSQQEREAETDRLYWRGTVYDSYGQGRWARSHREMLRSQIDESSGGRLVIREPHTEPPGARPPLALAATDRQEIDVVGVSAPVAFALDRPVAFELPAPQLGGFSDLRLVPRWSGEVAFQTASPDAMTGDALAGLHTFSGAHYVAYSRDPFAGVTATNGRPLAGIAPELMAPYLALPPDLSPRVQELARRIVAGRPTAAAKVMAVIDWLDKTHEYSADLGGGFPAGQAADPVESFLFDRKKGHCEYFASAAAILLRAAGVPTRYVNGFLGGEWNAVGQYVTVRQNRAHAWVEAYVGETGWMRVDATPPARAPGRMGRLGQLLDSIDFFWSRWVVGYDLGRQLDLARGFGRDVGLAAPGPSPRGAGAWTWRRLVAIAAIALGVAGVWLFARRRPLLRGAASGTVSAAAAGSPVRRLYRRCLDRLAERGRPRLPSETPLELAARVRAADLEGADDFTRLTELYVRARFGRKEVDDDDVGALGKRLGRLGLERPRGAPQVA